ncbi:MAG: hypothetical protein ACI9MC_002287 [Kiritimatiellia bacterium]|jgi:hypothetical protein
MLLLCFLGLVGRASDTTVEAQGPVASQVIPLPTGLEKGDRSVAPGPPETCVSKVQVFVPWRVCKPWSGGFVQGLAATRFDGRLKAAPPLGVQGCALVCSPDAKIANWSFVVPSPRYRGTLTCLVGRLGHTLQIGESSVPLSAGVTTQWQLNVSSTEYVVDDEQAIQGTPESMRKLIFETRREVSGDNVCPAGQPGGR